MFLHLPKKMNTSLHVLQQIIYTNLIMLESSTNNNEIFEQEGLIEEEAEEPPLSSE